MLPIFVLLVVVYKLWHKTKFVKLEEMDIYTGRREDFEMETEVEEVKQRSLWYKIRNVFVG